MSILNEIIIEKDEELWVCSDFHLGHDREFIWGKRGFKNIYEHDSFIIKNLVDSTTKFLSNNPGKSLTILHLGDLSFNDNSCARAKQLFNIKYLNEEVIRILAIPGNHAHNFKELIKSPDKKHIIGDQGQIRICGDGIRENYKSLIFSHYPILEWPRGANGVICGHCHGNEDQINLPNISNPKTYSLGSILDCGVDNALIYSNHLKCYFTINEIQKILKDKKVLKNKV